MSKSVMCINPFNYFHLAYQRGDVIAHFGMWRAPVIRFIQNQYTVKEAITAAALSLLFSSLFFFNLFVLLLQGYYNFGGTAGIDVRRFIHLDRQGTA